jgi:hypothetical protein
MSTITSWNVGHDRTGESDRSASPGVIFGRYRIPSRLRLFVNPEVFVVIRFTPGVTPCCKPLELNPYGLTVGRFDLVQNLILEVNELADHLTSYAERMEGGRRTVTVPAALSGVVMLRYWHTEADSRAWTNRL